MDTEFENDLATARDAVIAGRDRLLSFIGGLSDADLSQGRRGQWTIAQILDHVLQSDGYYINLVSDLREQPRPDQRVAPGVSSGRSAVASLNASADRILAAVDGVGEDAFYRMGGPAHQQYSILSVLENVALHDHEHSAQIAQVLDPVEP